MHRKLRRILRYRTRYAERQKSNHSDELSKMPVMRATVHLRANEAYRSTSRSSVAFARPFALNGVSHCPSAHSFESRDLKASGEFQISLSEAGLPRKHSFPRHRAAGESNGFADSVYPVPRTTRDIIASSISATGPAAFRGEGAVFFSPSRAASRSGFPASCTFHYRCRSVNLRSVAFTQERSRPFDGNNEEDISLSSPRNLTDSLAPVLHTTCGLL